MPPSQDRIRVVSFDRYITLANRFLEDPKVHHWYALTLMVALKRYADYPSQLPDGTDPQTWPRVSTIMRLSRIGSKRTFYAARRELIRAGWLRLHPRDPEHPNWPTLYILASPPQPVA